MALRKWVAIGLASLVALLITWALPPRPCMELDRRSITAMSVCGGYWTPRRGTHESSLRNASSRLKDRIRDLTLADTLRQALATGKVLRSADGQVSVIYEEPLSADEARGWLDQAVAERDHVPGTGTGTRVVVALRSAAWRQLLDKMTLGRMAHYAPAALRFSSTADSTCFVVLRVDRRFNRGETSFGEGGRKVGTFLGQCALMARFGIPGPAVDRSFASLYRTDSQYWSGGLRSSVVLDLREARRTSVQRTDDYRASACAQGALASCDAFMGLGRVQLDWFWSSPNDRTRGFVAYLLAEDPERFGRLWRSREPLKQALASSYGHPAPELVQAWARRRYVADARGPTPGGKTLLATLGWFGAAMIIAIVVGTRRRVDA